MIVGKSYVVKCLLNDGTHFLINNTNARKIFFKKDTIQIQFKTFVTMPLKLEMHVKLTEFKEMVEEQFYNINKIHIWDVFNKCNYYYNVKPTEYELELGYKEHFLTLFFKKGDLSET